MLDYFQVTGSTTYRYAIANTFDRNKGHSFTNEFMDDTGWWALAWIRAYDLTREQRYLDMAKHDADYIWSFKDQTCRGGIWWSAEKKYKNAITNELFVKIAASIYNRTHDRTYLDRALEIYGWFEASGMVNGGLLVNDGLTQDGTCKNNNGNPWSYNQGVILGGLVELSRATGDAKYLARARALANASTTNPATSPNGITRDACENGNDPCSGDGASFKGVYLRNLGELNQALTDHPYRAYIARQADSNYQKNRDSLDQYGTRWAGPYVPSDSAGQHSVLDVFVAAAR
jgi:predicted alpha-1,6-mannanase (GH76 family)